MFLLSLIAVSGCVTAFGVLALLPTEGNNASWKLAHLLLVPITVVSAMWVLSFLGYQPLTVEEAQAQLAPPATVAAPTATGTQLPLAPTPTGVPSGAATATPVTEPTGTSGAGGQIWIGPASVANGSLNVPVNTTASGHPWRGFNIDLVWDHSKFTYGGFDNSNSLAAASQPFCSGATIGPPGGQVVGCTAIDGSTYSSAGNLIIFRLTPTGTLGCTTLHLFERGGTDGGDAATGSYTINSNDPSSQTNTYGADTGVDQTGGACTPIDTPTATETSVTSSTPRGSGTGTPSPTEAVATETPSPSQTATPTVVITPLATASAVPVETEAVVDSTGAYITSADGHVTLEFPPGAATTPLLIKVSAKPHAETPVLAPGSHLLTAWQFDAFDINNSNVPVHQFAKNITIHLRYTSAELFGLREDLIRYWVRDEPNGQWVEQTVTPIDGADHEWTVQLNHFSTQASSSDGVINLPPILDSAQVNTNTGASTIRVPISAPAGPGGLQPDLALTYSSERADEVYGTTPASWVGVGWDLAAPSITRSGTRYFLNKVGVGSELLHATDYATSHRWVARNQQFLDIVHDGACDDLIVPGQNLSTSCQWTIRDQSGHTSVFGSDANPASRRYYWAVTDCGVLGYPAGYYRYYQWDLASVTDLHANTATYNYQPIFGWGLCASSTSQTVVSSYPTGITYPGGSVTFTLRSDNLVASSYIYGNSPGPFVMMRPDSAAFACPTYGCQLTPVQESRALASVNWSGAAGSGSYALHIDQFGSEARLSSVDVNPIGYGNQYTVGFTYQAGGTTWANTGSTCTAPSGAGGGSLLSTITNGFGGSTTFHYINTTTGGTCGPTSRWLVDKKTDGGQFNLATNPNIVKNYGYIGAAAYDADGHYRGFGQSTEADLDGDVVTTSFLTSGELAGRTSEQSVANGPSIRDVTYGWTSVPEGTTGAYVNHLLTQSTTLYGVTTTTTYSYDPTFGAVTQKVESAPGVCRTTTTAYAYQSPTSGSAYLVLPTTTQIWQDSPGCTLAAVASETVHYYDGTTGTGTLTKGNLTATRRLASGTQYVWTLESYNSNGLSHQVSVPIYGTATPPTSGLVDGAVLSTQGYTEVTYDTPVNSPLPATVTQHVFNPDGTAASPATETTTYAYDTLHRAIGKPWKMTSPLGTETGTDYDVYGRPTSSWQSPSTEASPDKTISYSWTGASTGGVNSTTLTDSSAREVDCFDGLGRLTQKDTNQSDYTTTLTWQRTQGTYDDRGLQVNTRLFDDTQACNPTSIGNGNSPSTPNKLVAHDALGNVTTTTINDGASPTPGHQSVTTISHPAATGIVTTRTIDQLGHQTETDVDGLGRTVARREYTGSGGSYSLYATTNYQYDVLDHLIKTTDAAGNVTQTTYDALGRKTTLTDPDMSGGNTPWLYEYDAAGNLTKQTDARGVVTTMTYDSLNRLRIKHYDVSAAPVAPASVPTATDVSYTYDAYDGDSNCAGQPTPIGKLTIMTDGSGSTRWCYDVRGREIANRRYIVGDATAYDVLHTYDRWNRVKTTTYPGAPGDVEVVTNTYDDAFPGRSGHLLASSSSLSGSIINGTKFQHPNGALSSLTLGDGALTSYGYDPLYRLGSITTTLGAATPENLSYGYLANGDVQTVVDAGETLTYSYDDLDRLTDMVSGSTTLAHYVYGGAPGTVGDLTSKQEGATSLALAYPTPATPASKPSQPHAVSSISGTQSRIFTLDRNGNQIGSANDEYIFDAENRTTIIYGAMLNSLANGTSKCMDFDHDGAISILDLNKMASKFGFARGNPLWDFRTDLDGDGHISILDLSAEADRFTLTCPAQKTAYLYDGLGNLVKRTSTDTSVNPGTNTWTEYIDGIYEKKNAGAVTKYYHAFGRPIAVRSVPTGTGAGTLTYLLADSLGSTVGAIDAVTGTVSTQKFYPFGAPRSGAVAQTDKAYTGQQQQPLTSVSTPLQGATDALGAYFYRARFYSPVTGRFLSADRKTSDGLNRYAYARNNPLRYNDPTGLDAASDLTALADAFRVFQSWGGTLDQFITVLGAFQRGTKDGFAALAILGFRFRGNSLSHIFKSEEGHLTENTPENQQLLKDVADNPDNYAGTDQYGKAEYVETLPDGSQVWVYVYNGEIMDGGVNAIPIDPGSLGFDASLPPPVTGPVDAVGGAGGEPGGIGGGSEPSSGGGGIGGGSVGSGCCIPGSHDLENPDEETRW